MGMGINSISAQELLNKCDLKTLKNILKHFGDEKDSSRIANNIIRERKKSPILLVPTLVDIIQKKKKKITKKKINICTQTFQAIRIFVNKEVTELVNGLIKANEIFKRRWKINRN